MLKKLQDQYTHSRFQICILQRSWDGFRNNKGGSNCDIESLALMFKSI